MQQILLRYFLAVICKRTGIGIPVPSSDKLRSGSSKELLLGKLGGEAIVVAG